MSGLHVFLCICDIVIVSIVSVDDVALLVIVFLVNCSHCPEIVEIRCRTNYLIIQKFSEICCC